MTLFKEIMAKKMSVREAEAIARRIALDRVRKKDWTMEPEIVEMEKRLKEMLGTKVSINKSENGGRITIDFHTTEDIHNILAKISLETTKVAEVKSEVEKIAGATPLEIAEEKPIDDRPKEEVVKEENEEIFNLLSSPTSFSHCLWFTQYIYCSFKGYCIRIITILCFNRSKVLIMHDIWSKATYISRDW
jgi:hypothetical protein